MDDIALELNGLLAEFWAAGASDRDLALAIAERCVPWDKPTSLTTASRCLQVIPVADLDSSFDEQAAAFRAKVETLAKRAEQLDSLGDPGTPARDLFELFNEEAEGIDASGFDATKLESARRSTLSRLESGWRLLETFGLKRLPSALRDELTTVYQDLENRGRKFQSQALFVDARGHGIVLGINVGTNSSGDVITHDKVDQAMVRQAKWAFGTALPGRGVDWGIEWAIEGEGSSIGVACFIAGLVEAGLPPDPLLCGSGEVAPDKTIRAVTGIEAKLEAAYHAGMRRVVLAEENRPQAKASPYASRLQLLFVRSTSEIHGRIREVKAATDLGFDGLVHFVRALLSAPDSGVDLLAEKAISHARQFVVADASGRGAVNVYQTSTVTINASPGRSLEAALKRVLVKIDAGKPVRRAALTYRVEAEHRRKKVEDLLRQAGAIDVQTGQSETWRLELLRGQSRAIAVLYSTGTLRLLDGQAPAFDEAQQLIEQALEGIVPKGSANGEQKRTAPEIDETRPHIGTDEAGKGDYFGPLVSAAMFVDARLARQLRAIGVRDSKTLSDATVRRLAAEIKRLAPRSVKVTTITPKSYNDLYDQFRREGKNLNQLLAWGHVRSIEDLLERGIKAETAVVDQFADRKYIENRLLQLTRESQMEIVQFPKAEADIAVAAASVLARDGFVDWLERASAELGWTVPKGASQQVIEAGRRLVAERGQAALREYAKVSFKTTQAVLAG